MRAKRTPRTTSDQGARLYRLKVSLADIKPMIWRRLLIRADANLAFLHSAIQVAMGWTNSHLHQFIVGEQKYTHPKMMDDFWGECHDLSELQAGLADVAPREKARFVYEYDFGDSWQHVITVEKILEPDPEHEGDVECLGGARACPPEDCGGAWGYGSLLEALSDPKHEEHESMLEWIGGEFDAEAFDLEKVNVYLRKLKRPQPTVGQLAKVLMARDGVRE